VCGAGARDVLCVLLLYAHAGGVRLLTPDRDARGPCGVDSRGDARARVPAVRRHALNMQCVSLAALAGARAASRARRQGGNLCMRACARVFVLMDIGKYEC
jgi:hypothetical protein